MMIAYAQQRRDVVDATRLLSGRKFIYLFGFFWCLPLLVNIPRFATSVNAGRGFSGALNDNSAAVVTSVLLAFLLIGLAWLQPILAARKAVLRSVEWRFSDDGVNIQSDVASSEMRWPVFLKFKEGRRVFLLYIQKNQAQFIPKRALSEEQQEELRQLLSSHIKAS